MAICHLLRGVSFAHSGTRDSLFPPQIPVSSLILQACPMSTPSTQSPESQTVASWGHSFEQISREKTSLKRMLTLLLQLTHENMVSLAKARLLAQVLPYLGGRTWIRLSFCRCRCLSQRWFECVPQRSVHWKLTVRLVEFVGEALGS